MKEAKSGFEPVIVMAIISVASLSPPVSTVCNWSKLSACRSSAGRVACIIDFKVKIVAVNSHYLLVGESKNSQLIATIHFSSVSLPYSSKLVG